MRRRDWVLTIAVLVASLTRVGASRSQTASDPGPLIGFSISAHGVQTSGGEAGGGTVSRHWKADGESGTLHVYQTGGSCAVGLSSEPPRLPNALVVWTFDARLVSHDEDGAVVDLVSRRVVNDTSLGFSSLADRYRRLYLFEGQPIPLDYAALDQSQSNDCDGYSISASMYFVYPPEVADARLSYDLWLIYTDARGSQTTQRIESQSGQGRTADFGFSPLWFDTAGQLSPTGTIGLSVSGNVRGRLLPDGTVHVNLGAVRLVRDRMGSGTAQAGGTSTNIALGETVEVQLPPMSEYLAPFGSIERLFTGATIAVRVTPRRIA
jgi:hypothetical protein